MSAHEHVKGAQPASDDKVVAALREELEAARRSLRLRQQEVERARGDAELDKVRYRELFAWAPEAYLVTDLHGAILESNNAASALLNTSIAALKRKPLAVYIHRDELRNFVKRIANIRESDETETFLQQLFPKHKHPVTALISVSRTGSTQPSNNLRWILRDVTDREEQREEIERLNRELETRVEQRTLELRQSLAALRKTESRLSLAFGIETVGVIFFDSAGRITDCNSAFLRMAGFTRDDFDSGMLRWDKITPRDWVETAALASHEFFISGRSEPYEREYFRKDGSRWWGMVAAQWLSQEEGVEFVIDVTDRKQAERELIEAQRTVEAHRARKNLRRQLAAAEEQQRKRLARDLHDQLGQHLTAFSLELGHARGEVGENAAARMRLAQLSDLAAVMTRDARSLALELRPPELDDVGLASAVESYLGQWAARYDVEVDVELANIEGDSVEPEAAIVIYRILQEAMTNVARHASAKCVSVILERPDGYINLIVEDDGTGFDVDEVSHRATRDRRFGLAGMRERAEIAGGRLTIESARSRGTTVFAQIPVEEKPATG